MKYASRKWLILKIIQVKYKVNGKNQVYKHLEVKRLISIGNKKNGKDKHNMVQKIIKIILKEVSLLI